MSASPNAPLPRRVRERLPASGDPTSTVTLRRRWKQGWRNRWRQVRGDIRHTIDRQNALALDDTTSTPGSATPQPVQQYRPDRLPHHDDAQREASLGDWLQYVITGRVATTRSREAARAGDAWWDDYLRDAYIRGLGLAVADAKAAGRIDPDETQYDPTDAFTRAQHQTAIRQQRLRTHQDVQHAAEATHTDAMRTAGELLGTGLAARTLADRLTDRVAAVGQTRTEIIAETRAVDTVNRAIIEQADDMGADTLGVVPEAGQRRPREMTEDERSAHWATAADERVCAICATNAGITTTPEAIKKGNEPVSIPAHPRCRCRWVITG